MMLKTLNCPAIYCIYFIFQVVRPCSYQCRLRRRPLDECSARSLASVPRSVWTRMAPIPARTRHRGQPSCRRPHCPDIVPRAPVTTVSLETARRAASPATRPDRPARYRNIKVIDKTCQVSFDYPFWNKCWRQNWRHDYKSCSLCAVRIWQ